MNQIAGNTAKTKKETPYSRPRVIDPGVPPTWDGRRICVVDRFTCGFVHVFRDEYGSLWAAPGAPAYLVECQVGPDVVGLAIEAHARALRPVLAVPSHGEVQFALGLLPPALRRQAALVDRYSPDSAKAAPVILTTQGGLRRIYSPARPERAEGLVLILRRSPANV